LEPTSGPCRAIGLVKSGESRAPQPFLLTPRGKKIWDVRNATLGDGTLRRLLWHSDTLSPDDAGVAAPHFSLMGLARAKAEAACLREALETAWAPAGGGGSVARAYQKFAGTLAGCERKRSRGRCALTRCWRTTIAAPSARAAATAES
jgi:hypothetical protein